MLVLDDGELVNREPVVGSRVVVVRDTHLHAPDTTGFRAVLHRHAVHEHAVEDAVAGFQCRPVEASQLAESVVAGGIGKLGVEPRQCVSEPPFEHDFAVIRPLRSRRIGGDAGSVGNRPADAFEPVEGGVLDSGFGYAAHPTGSASRLTTRRIIRSLPAGALSAMSSVSAVSARGSSRCSTPSCFRYNRNSREPMRLLPSVKG